MSGKSLVNRSAVAGEEEIPEVCVISFRYEGDCGGLQDLNNGDFDWVRQGVPDKDLDRDLALVRQEAAQLTAAACRLGRYSFDDREVVLKQIQDMKKGTRLINVSGSSTSAGGKCDTDWQTYDAARTPLTMVALNAALEGRKVAVLTSANAYLVGGGFARGGRHGLEESLCTQSTLHTSLMRAALMAQEQGLAAPKHVQPSRSEHGPWQAYIPEHGVVLSPNVEFFRGDAEEGYPFMEAAVPVAAVVSVAMPNCNPKVKDAPVDQPPDRERYLKTIETKILAALEAAVSVKATVLVVPALGCDKYKNKPEVVGQIFSETVSTRFPNAFDEIHIVGTREFNAACSKKPKRPAPPPGPPPTGTTLGNPVAPPVGLRSSGSASVAPSVAATGRPREDLERRLKSLKNSVSQISGDFVYSISQGAEKLGGFSKEGMQRQRDQIRREKAELQDARLAIQMERRELEEQQAELDRTREQLLKEMEEVTAAKEKGGCCVC